MVLAGALCGGWLLLLWLLLLLLADSTAGVSAPTSGGSIRICTRINC